MTDELTLGSVPAGIGGFDLGFKQAGWETLWQIELDDVNRAVLADRFPRARRFKDLRDWRSYNLARVRCIAAGFPCQDLSCMANASRSGLAGPRSSLFFEIMEIVRFLQPSWLVLENVPGLFSANDCRDFQSVIVTLAQCGYLGFWRVLDAQYFGVPQKRRRVVLVAGLGRYPHMDFMADAAPVESISRSLAEDKVRPGDEWAGYTLTAPDKYRGCNSRINLGSEILVAEENGWDQMAQRARATEADGLSVGLDAANTEEAFGAGNAFPPPIAKWIAEILKRS